jgi:hypothetical protein
MTAYAADNMKVRSHMDDPSYWRNRASEMRKLASLVTHQIHKNEMLKVAAEYDQLATRAEELAKQEQ